MSEPRVLIAGIGNIFLGDDAFGVEVVRRLAARQLPEGVEVRDFGIRGYDLAFALMDDYDRVLLVDAALRGGEPGTVYTIEIGADDAGCSGLPMNGHSMNPMLALEMVRTLGGTPRNLLLVGCEPFTLGDDEEGALGLSPPVEAAVEVAIQTIEQLLVRTPCA